MSDSEIIYLRCMVDTQALRDLFLFGPESRKFRMLFVELLLVLFCQICYLKAMPLRYILHFQRMLLLQSRLSLFTRG